MTKLSLNSSLNQISGIGEKTFQKLQKHELDTIKDLLQYYPKNHLIYQKTHTTQAKTGDHVILFGNISNIQSKKKARMTYQSATFTDKAGSIELRWFNQPYLTRSIDINSHYEIQGQVENFYGTKQIVNPKIRKAQKPSSTHLSPKYPQSGQLKSNWFKRFVKKTLKQTSFSNDPIPEKLRKKYHLIDRKTAFKQIHYPTNFEQLEKAHKRLSFEELFLLQLNALQEKKEKQTQAKPIEQDEKKLNKFINNLDFELTNSQIQSIEEITNDLKKKKTMNRLLLGDVGSGKTIVAISASYLTYLSNLKTIVMAPTQILAQQLKDEFKKQLKQHGIKIKLLTGQTKEEGDYDILIGTHALIQNLQETFDDIGLIVIDEQHKFGVEQRKKLTKKGKSPHKLTMSATPIPRTLALTLLSNLDISYLDEMPKGRKKIKTYLIPEKKRQKAYKWIDNLIKEQKYKVFTVTPLIEESKNQETKHLKSTQDVQRTMKKAFPDKNIDLLHGRLSEDKKNNIIQSFKNGKTDILISTTVIEVGMDVPEANIMIVESAERFGLSQLHQLRGRIGRSDKQGYCLLFTTELKPKAKKRLTYFTHHNKGSKLAELDMKLRGPGEVWGTQQHGFFNLKLANIFDKELVKTTYQAAEEVLDLST